MQNPGVAIGQGRCGTKTEKRTRPVAVIALVGALVILAQPALAACKLGKIVRHAAKASPFYSIAAASRGLVRLRLGQYDKSIADYEASLKINPKDAWSLYGRGIDETHLSKPAAGQADMDEAVKIRPEVADEFKRHGIAP